MAAALPLAGQETLRARAASITIGGRLHAQYDASSVDGADADFYFRRARMLADITVSDFLSGRLQPEFAEDAIQLKDAYARLAFDPAFRVTLGQFKRPFSAFELVSTTDFHVIERDGRIEGLGVCAGVGGVCSFSRLTEKLQFDDRDQGVRVDGDLPGGFAWAASVTNGEGANTSDVNSAKSVSGRLEWTSGSLVLGAFAAVHDHADPEDADATLHAPAAGLDVGYGTWRSGPYFLGALAFGENWAVGEDVSFAAAQVVGSWYVAVDRPRLAGVEPLLRLSWADPDGDTDDDEGLLVTPGFVFYVVGKNGIALNLDWYEPGGPGGAEWSFKVKTFLYF